MHVDADVAHRGTGSLRAPCRDSPESDETAAVDVLFGAASLLGLERRFASHLLDSWGLGACSLYLSTAEPPSVSSYREVSLR